jgi:amino acid adenylation domain-containing protein
MSGIAETLQKLSPEKRALLSAKLPPLSFAQQRMWFLDYYKPKSHYYTIATAVQLTGPLNVPALERSFTASIRRHQVLRTNFVMLGDHPVQFVHAAGTEALPVIDLSEVPADRQLDHAQRLATEESQRPFDLTSDKLIRLSLLRLERDKHVLLLAMHHIIGDGWSTGILIREVSIFYDAYSHGREPQLPELPIQYTDYAVWQRNWLQGEVLKKELDYWRRELSGAPPVLELPTDRPRPAIQSHRGSHYTARLSQPVSDGLRALGQEETVTTFMLLLAAFQVFLYRYTGQEDICVGTPIAGRNRIESEALIGLLVNTLVIRTELSQRQSFRDVLRNVRDKSLEAFAHQNVPFERLVEVLQPERSLNRTPFFQVMFSLQNAAAAETPQMGDLKLEFWKHDKSLSQFDLMLTTVETDRFNFTVEYNTDLFDETTIVRMLGHFQNLLEEIVRTPDERIGRLSLLNDGERRQTVEQWNQTSRDYPREATIQAIFEAQVARTPNALAVVCGQRQLTYRELNAHANQLAHHLQTLGVGPDVLVGTCMERSAEMVVALLGILKAGGAYVPLDPSYPMQRLSTMLEDSRVRILLAMDQTVDQLPVHRGQIICIDGDWPIIGAQSTENPSSEVSAENLAYVIYTSGSTGEPKGVCVPHRAVNRLVNNTNYINLMPSDVVAQFSNASFDAATFEFWGALLNGARLVVMPPQQLSLADLGRAIEENRVTTLWLTAGLFHLMVDEQLESLRGLKYLLAGGDVLSLAHVERFRRELPGCRLINGYGPTENTTFTSCHQVENSEQFGNSVPIGRPIANTQVYILDREMRVVPVGVFGELYAGGDGLARGYLRNAELTAERFVPDGVSGMPGARLYRTGDTARRLANGDLEFLGRIDDQVKLRGFRVELGEIEAVLGRYSGISQCAVMARMAGSGDKRLVAYIVSANDLVTAGELRSYLQERLPDYMVPASYVFLDQLPLTANGKVARKELPEPDADFADGETEYVAPRSPAEEMLAGIWSTVLNREQLGVTDDFFELGGHSLLATQVVSRVREIFGVEVPLRELFEYPTIAGFGKRIEEAAGREQDAEAPPIRRAAREGGIPLSFAQQRLWFLHQLKPESAVYNVNVAVRLRGPLNIAVLEQTLTEVVKRHEMLRTTFALRDGEPVQVIGEPESVRLPVVDLSALPESERENESRRLVGVEAQQPFDLSTGPLLRVGLISLTAEEHVLPLTVHHIISDGWSIGVMVREVATLFAAFSKEEPSPLPALAVQYADFAIWQREWFRDEILERQLDYWRNQLSGTPPILELPIDKARPPVQSFNGSHEPLGLDEQISKELRKLSRREGVTMFMTLLAAWQLLLSRYTGQEDIVVGTPIAGRNRLETEDLIGFFVNTLVLRTDLRGNPSFREVLKRVREVLLGAYSHQDVPFERLVEELQTERSLSHTPLFQVAIALQNAPQESLDLTGLELSEMESENQTAKFDLTLTLAESEQLIGGALVYNSDLFEASTIKRLVAHYTALLQAVIKHPELRLSELTLLSEVEREQLVVEFNDRSLAYERDKLVPQLFAEQVRHAPHGLAVIDERQQLTYGELNERANELAQHLRELGVGPETVTGVCLERSVEMVVALLAVLKAGGAYLPLDTAYPASRISFMLSDAGAAVLLTSRAVLPRLQVPDEVQVLCCDELPAVVAVEQRWPAVAGDNLAYVIYTSGSTGQPKGVMISHRSLLNLVQWHIAEYGLTAEDRVTQLASAGFDAAVWELWPALCAGASVQVVPDEVRAVAAELRQWLTEAGITVSFVPTPLTEKLLGESWPTGGRLRALLTGGDQLHVYRGEVEFAVVNHYGPTEVTVLCTAAAVARTARVAGELPAIGRAVANTQVYVLDEWQQLAPLGVVGELYIGGAGVARGYLGRAALTAARFVPDGVSGREGERLYRTGDLVRYGGGGELEYVGRVDQQVKLRGFRIELGEIEAVLREHPRVRESAVMARQEQGSEKRLVAYVTGQLAEENVSLEELREFVRGRLPEYMVPASFMELAELPLTSNGKVDRKKLPAPERSNGKSGNNYMSPRDPLQELLAAMWKEILGVAAIGIEDDFFSVNGDSIKGAVLINQLREKLGEPVPVATIFKAPTIQRMAAYLRQEYGANVNQVIDAEHWSPLVTIQEGYGRAPLFLVHPVGGNIFCYASLAHELGPEYTVYGLQARGLDDGQSPLTEIEAMATEYLEAIRGIEPVGPYRLAGWSMGGLIAFEMARQLQLQNQEVSFVGLIDPTDPNANTTLPDDDRFALVRFAIDLGLTHDHVTRPLDELTQLHFDEQLSYVLELVKSANLVPADTSLAYLHRLFAVFQNNVRAVRTYRPPVYEGEITLFTARERPASAPEPEAAWSTLALGGLSASSVPGDHYSMFRPPHVQTLAQELKATLDREAFASKIVSLR